jgi:hypothetical protein
MATATKVQSGQIVRIFFEHKWKNVYVLEGHDTCFCAVCPDGEQRTFQLDEENESWRVL